MQQAALRSSPGRSTLATSTGHAPVAPVQGELSSSPDDLLKSATGIKYPYALGKLTLAPLAEADVVAGRALLDGPDLATVLDRYLRAFPGVDPRAAVSMWSMYYFSALGIPSMLHWLELRRTLPSALADIQVSLAPATGLPQGFVLPHIGKVTPDIAIDRALSSLIEDHAAPLIERIVADHGLGARLLWSNLASYLTWIVHEVGRLTDPRLAEEGGEFLQCAVWPSGMKNPMAGLNRREDDGHGGFCTRRRVCCLRYMLPGIPGCGTSCPLPAGRP